jgi:ABC-2 type transport system ATP-binding protein
MTPGSLAIDVRGVTKRFDGRTVVDAIDLQVPRGSICGFLGPNGSGKTTFIRMLCGLLTPDAGEGTCLGYDIRRESLQIKQQVGYMTQKFSLFEDLTIEENLDLVSRIYAIPRRREAVAGALAALRLEGRRHQLAGQLSGGWKQRLSLACCRIHHPQLLLLDEPTAGVDPAARREFWEEIHELAAQGVTVLITTHYMDEAERCHSLAYLAFGKLLTRGTVAEVIAGSGLTTWEVEGPDLPGLAARLRKQASVEQVAAFGNRLHVSTTHREALESATASFRLPPYTWRLIEPGLEDVFMALMARARDNFSA